MSCLDCANHKIYGSCHFVDVWCKIKKDYVEEPFEICESYDSSHTKVKEVKE